MSADFIDINLLPRPVRPPLLRDMRQRMMVGGLLLIVLAILLILGATLVKMRNDRQLAEQRARLHTLSEAVRDFSAVMADVELLQEQVARLARETEQIRSDAERVSSQRSTLSPFLQSLTETLLPRMTITGIVAEQPRRYIVQGEAGSSSLVIDYISALEQRPEVRDVTPRSIEALGEDRPPGAVRWTLVVER